MNDQTIPAEKVRELADKYNGDVPTDPHFLLGEIKADLRDLLPAPPQPTGGLLGRWAKHPEHGDVVCGWDRPDVDGSMLVRWLDEKAPRATNWVYAPFDSLTFPEQTTRPEDVPAGEAWLVDVNFNNGESHSSIAAFKDSDGQWRTSDGITNIFLWHNSEVTLVAPLTPERPGKSDEQPTWRIEHDWQHLKAGEYAIDKEGYDGIIRRKSNDGSYWLTDESWVFFPEYAPFIVFPSVDAATPEAIEEAKRARDKEVDK